MVALNDISILKLKRGSIAQAIVALPISAGLLTSCGGGGDNSYSRGALLETPQTVTTLSAAQINAGATTAGLLALTGSAKCDVQVVALNYATIGVNSESTNASGVMLLPAGACASNAYPLIAYARGTDVLKTRTMADPSDKETFGLAAMYAAQGYAVVATDYLGYAKSAYTYHPYLHADSEATTVIDSIRAARNVASTRGIKLSGKVMLTGYSQGGHAAFAAQRAIERDHANEINVVASAPAAGPYSMSNFVKTQQAILGSQYFVPFVVTSYQKIYGNIYSDRTQVFKAPYSNYIESLLPSPTLTYATLLTTGTLPAGTPDQTRSAIFQPLFITDTQTNPNSPLLLAAQKNDLLSWNPKARTQLCAGEADPTVPTALNQDVAQAAFSSRGLTNVTSVNVDAQIRATFGIGGLAPTDPASAAFAAYYAGYHNTFAPPFCFAAARALFEQLK